MVMPYGEAERAPSPDRKYHGRIAKTAVANRNIKFLSHTDQGGRGDGVQVMINRGYA